METNTKKVNLEEWDVAAPLGQTPHIVHFCKLNTHGITLTWFYANNDGICFNCKRKAPEEIMDVWLLAQI